MIKVGCVCRLGQDYPASSYVCFCMCVCVFVLFVFVFVCVCVCVCVCVRVRVRVRVYDGKDMFTRKMHII